jgi:phage tail-like protein
MEQYKNFQFRIKWGGNYVAGVRKVSAIKEPPLIKHREGGDPGIVKQMPTPTGYEAITLERGVTHDPAFEQWCNKVWDNQALKDDRKDITIEIYNDAGNMVMTYNVYRCWVSKYQAMPELDSHSNAVIIQSIKLENEGWERANVTTKK